MVRRKKYLAKLCFYAVSFLGKLASLVRFLMENRVKKGLVFLPTCACVDYWGTVLPRLFPKGFEVPLLSLHGKMKEKRSKVLDIFRKSHTAILLATDLLARGIDVPEVIFDGFFFIRFDLICFFPD